MKYFLIAAIAFLCESIDSSLGMGYGTLLTPILILMGYEPLEIVPLILCTEFITGILAAILHHKKGNVRFARKSIELKTAFVLAICSIVGTISASYLAISLNKTVIKSYIAILLIFIGFTTFISISRKLKFSWKKILGLGLLASFNKGISGGGYGPLVTGGQMLSGINGKSAVGVTSLSEGLTCLVGIISYFFLNELDFNINLTIALLAGSLLSIPISVNIISIINEKTLKRFLSAAIIILGFVNVFTIINPLQIILNYHYTLLLVIIIILIIIKLWYTHTKNRGTIPG